MMKTIVISEDKSIQIDTENIKPTDTIIITVDNDIWDLDVCHNLVKMLEHLFPYNKIFMKFKGINIDKENPFMTFEEIDDKIIWQKPEYTLLTVGKYSLIAELDIFNNHIEYYTSYDNYEEGHSSNINEAIKYFYNKINENNENNSNNTII